jgi:phosphatidylinositol alpha-1,6-mannosyltransferase
VRLLSVGRLVPRKGHQTLIRAIAAARVEGIDCELFIVGDGPERKRLQAEIDRLCVASSVKLVGGVSSETLSRLYEESDIFALITQDCGRDFEGFGIVFLEAAARGLPIIAGTSGGTIEAIAPGYNALVVRDFNETTSAIIELAKNPEKRREMSNCSLSHAQASSWEMIAQDWLALYSRLLA